MHCAAPIKKAININSRRIEYVAQINDIWVIDMNMMHYTSVTYLDRRASFSLCALIHLLVQWCAVQEQPLERVCEEMKMWGWMDG